MTLSLVTGGAGFVGRRLVEALMSRGEAVRVLDIAPSEAEDWIQGSVTDPHAVEAAMAGVDTVFHLAGNAQLWARNRRIFDEVNHLGTRIVLRAAREAGVRRFVHCSSLTTLVGRSTPIGVSFADETREISAAEMLGPYPKSKRLAENAVMEAVKDGLDAVIAIPTEPLGAGDESLTPPTRMIMDFINGKTPAFIDCTLNFVPVASLAEGMIAARDRGRRGERYLLGGENVDMAQLLATLEKISGRIMPKTKLPYAFAQIAGFVDTGLIAPLTGKPPKAPLTGVRLAGRRVSFSSEKAARELSWHASSFEAALQETLEWMKAAGLAR